MTNEQILDKRNRMAEHLYRLLMAHQISENDYSLAMRDLHQWMEAKKRKQSC